MSEIQNGNQQDQIILGFDKSQEQGNNEEEEQMDIELEENEQNLTDIQKLQKYLALDLKEPVSLLQILDLFPNLDRQQIISAISDLRNKNIIGSMQLYLPKNNGQASSARLEYIQYNKRSKIMQEKEQEIKKQQAEQDLKKQQQQLQQQQLVKKQQHEKVNEESYKDKQLEQMTNEELVHYERTLGLKKQKLIDKKNKINPTSERIKKIHQFNEMKELCSSVFEKLGTCSGKTIAEVCDDYGVCLDDE